MQRERGGKSISHAQNRQGVFTEISSDKQRRARADQRGNQATSSTKRRRAVIDFCGRLKLDNYSLVTGIVLKDYFFFCINTLTSMFDC